MTIQELVRRRASSRSTARTLDAVEGTVRYHLRRLRNAAPLRVDADNPEFDVRFISIIDRSTWVLNE